MLKSVIGRLQQSCAARSGFGASLGMVLAGAAHAAPSIGTGGGTAYAKLTTWLQNLVDFMSGPFGIAVVVISIIIAFSVWSFAPKEGIAGPVMRIVVSAIAILNVGTWLATFS